jgi:uncharacterized repeat protein (TIGR01451 family)/fimbrial isopeptide formation D2 family protein
MTRQGRRPHVPLPSFSELNLSPLPARQRPSGVSMKRQASLCLLSALMISAGTPAGVVIENTAVYEDDLIRIPSNTVRVTVTPVCAADLAPTLTERSVQPGDTVTTPFVLTNTGNSTQTYPVTLGTNDLGAQVVADLNGNGLPDDAATSSVTLDPDGRVTLLVTATAQTSGLHTVTLTTGCEGNLTATLKLNSRHIAPLITKTVLGDNTIEENATVQYRITVTNPERVAMPDVVIEDELNMALEFVEVNPESSVSVSAIDGGRTLLRWRTDLAASESKSYVLTARIRRGIPDDTEVTNTANATNEGGTAISTPPAIIRVFTSRILVSKAVEPVLVDPGGQVTYTVTVFNPSTTTITDTVMIDTPDPVLSVDLNSVTVGGKPMPATLEGQTLRVPLGSLNSNTGVTVRYTARVPLQAAGRPVVNSVVASARGRQGTVIATIVSNLAAANVVMRPKLSASGNDLVGRVYVDRNRNQRFEQGTDTPLQNARVLLAGGREVTTDSNGLYAFANVPSGMHAVRLDPQSVPYKQAVNADSLHGAFEAGSAAVQVNALLPNVAGVSLTSRWTGPNTTVAFTAAPDIILTAANRSDRAVCLLIGSQRVNLNPRQTLSTPLLPSGQPTAPTPQEVTCP